MKKEIPYHKKIEQKYQKSVEIPALAKKKKQLADIRDFYKPIDKDDMEKHKKDYYSTKVTNEEKVKKNREKDMKDLKDHRDNLHYKPNNDPELID